MAKQQILKLAYIRDYVKAFIKANTKPMTAINFKTLVAAYANVKSKSADDFKTVALSQFGHVNGFTKNDKVSVAFKSIVTEIAIFAAYSGIIRQRILHPQTVKRLGFFKYNVVKHIPLEEFLEIHHLVLHWNPL